MIPKWLKYIISEQFLVYVEIEVKPIRFLHFLPVAKMVELSLIFSGTYWKKVVIFCLCDLFF